MSTKDFSIGGALGQRFIILTTLQQLISMSIRYSL